eukprot:jgi/Tetstr1/431610/TSEL_021140.t1
MANISLNMSDFQISCLLEAIRRSRAKYVWLDRLSVPQADCSLKYTILARMMAVYTAARSTVVIRSVELPGSRYHQRAWTFQEFCASCELDIRTERTDTLESARAVQGDEQAAVEELRARFQGTAERVVPFWARNDETCTPVEGQVEQISLVMRISRTSGQDLQDWKNALLEQHMALRRAKVMGPPRQGQAAPIWQESARGIQSSFMVTAVQAQGWDVGGTTYIEQQGQPTLAPA